MYDEENFGRGWGHKFGFLRGHKFFERGHLKFVILDLIKQEPRHGYDIIQVLEEQFHGFYSPSAGTVYPILQLLEDQGFVKINEQEGKKVYTITDEGKEYLEDHEEELEHFRKRGERFEEKFGPYAYDLFAEVRDIMPLIFRNLRHGALKDEKKMKAFKAALEDFRKKVEKIFPEE